MKNGSCNVENGSVKWKMEVGKWKSETRCGMAPIGHGMFAYTRGARSAMLAIILYTHSFSNEELN